MGYFNLINKLNFLPTKEDGRFKVRSAQFNDLVDKLNNFFPSAGNITADVVGDLTGDVTGDLVGSVVLTKGTVTQLVGITTGVTVNAPAGVITTVSSTLAAGSNATFIVTNSFVTATSVVQLTVDDSATAGLAKLNVQTVGAGVFSVNVTNIHSANAFNNTLDIHFVIV
jgi:hypothetical protein